MKGANIYSLLVTDERYFDGLPVNKPLCSRYDGGYANPSYKDPDSLNDRISFADYIGAEVYRDNYVFIERDPGKQEGNFNSGFPYHGGVSYGTNLGTVCVIRRTYQPKTDCSQVGFYPDFNRAVARERWGEQYQYLFENGLEFVWQDMTTPAAGNCYGDMLGFESFLEYF